MSSPAKHPRPRDGSSSNWLGWFHILVHHLLCLLFEHVVLRRVDRSAGTDPNGPLSCLGLRYHSEHGSFNEDYWEVGSEGRG